MLSSADPRFEDQADVAVVDFDGERVEVLRTVYHAKTFPRHSHDTYTIGVGLRGTGAIWCRGANHLRRRGDIVVISPGELHTGGVAPHSDVLSYLAVYVPGALLERCARAEGVRSEMPEFPEPVLKDPLVAQTLSTLARLLPPASAVGAGPRRDERSNVGHAPIASAQDGLALAIATLVRHHARWRSPAVQNDPMIVSTVRQIIHACYTEPLRTSLTSLAWECGVTPFHLIRTFTRATGVSPHQYLLQVRVARARALLSAGEPPSRVAALTGFVDQSHLTAHFKRFVGITPGRYHACMGSVGRART
jgi:AraC-like DNA-binding protein/quercetin dioxygenase-like cupin family protein